jgi:Histidine kinase-, DNA gyrase B-, and HSP90-like ATPase/His Kinase A (phospho-acceptor) domain
MNFFQNLFGSHDFDELPNATLNKEGFVLESNDLFKKHFTNSNDIRLKDIIKSKTVDNKVICIKDGYQWTMVHKNIGRDRYRVWLVPEVEDAPSVWNLINIPMIWIDKMFEIKYTNISFVTKYCQNFLSSMLVNGESRELIWNKKLCKITFYKKSEDLYLLMIRDDFKNEKSDNADNLHSIGQVTSAVVHDFRNILSVINGYCELLIEEKDGLKDDCMNYITQIHSTVSSASTMVKELLKFTKAQINTDVSTCLYDVIFNMRHVINKLLGSNVQVKFNFEDKIGHVGLSVVDLERIIVNMVINAKDAIKDEGIIEISILKKYFDKNWKVNDCHLRAGFYLVLRFEDTGCGIKPENQEKIFSPFFTTKKNGNGRSVHNYFDSKRHIRRNTVL